MGVDSVCVAAYISFVNNPYVWNQLPYINYPTTSTQGHIIALQAITPISATRKQAYPNTNWNDPSEVEMVLRNEGIQ